MNLNKMLSNCLAILLLCLLSVDLIVALRDVRVKIPHAVRRGEKAELKCLYDLEGDSLYSVKWYKGRREFYSFTPKETPAMKVFQFAGVKVERSASNESQLVLESVNLATTGKYSCEVSADAPSFHTLISAGELEVVEVPGKDPIITGIRPRYRVGDIVRGNCTSRHSKPAANLTWTINGYETNPAHIRYHKPLKDARELETAITGIHFVVTPQHFNYGKLKVRCTAHIHDVYWKSTEKSIEEERHKHNTGNSINLVNTFSDDYFDMEEGNLVDRSDTYMTHIKGDVSSLNSGGSMQHFSCLPLWPRLTVLGLLAYAIQQMLQLWRQLSSSDTAASAAAATIAATKGKIIAPTLAQRSDRVNNEIGNTKGQLVPTSGTSGVAIATASAASAAVRRTTKTTIATETLCCKMAKRQQQTKTEKFALIKRKAQQQKQKQLKSSTTAMSFRSVATKVATTTTTMATQCCLTTITTTRTTT